MYLMICVGANIDLYYKRNVLNKIFNLPWKLERHSQKKIITQLF